MSFLSDYHEYLIIGSLTGSLTPAEGEELRTLLQEDQLARERLELLRGKFSSGDIDTAFSRFREPGKWKNISAGLKRRKAPSVYRQYAMAAAVVAGMILSGWWYWKNSSPQLPATYAESIKTDGEPSDKKILLTLSDGRQVDLSASEGPIELGSATLDNRDATLSYSNGQHMTGVNTLVVPIGSDYKIVLADGSKIWLNAATRLEFPFGFNGQTREISLDGEAYLEVSPDRERPFIVHLPEASIRVLGTEFNVNSYDAAAVKVSLVAGAVHLQAARSEVTLAPGKEAVFSGSSIQQREFDERHTLSWKEGLYYFQKANLKDIAVVLQRWYGVTTAIDNEAILTRKFTGVVNKHLPIEVFMEDIKAISGIDSYLGADKVLHFK